MKSHRSRLAIAGCMSVRLELEVSYNEGRALEWALRHLDVLTTRRIISIPAAHRNVLAQPSRESAPGCSKSSKAPSLRSRPRP